MCHYLKYSDTLRIWPKQYSDTDTPMHMFAVGTGTSAFFCQFSLMENKKKTESHCGHKNETSPCQPLFTVRDPISCFYSVNN